MTNDIDADIADQVRSVSVQRDNPWVLSSIRHRHLPAHRWELRQLKPTHEQICECTCSPWKSFWSGSACFNLKAQKYNKTISILLLKESCNYLVTLAPTICSQVFPFIRSFHFSGLSISQVFPYGDASPARGQAASPPTARSPAYPVTTILIVSALQEEMVLAFLFIPYMAGYLLLHLNIQVDHNIYIKTSSTSICINIRWSPKSIWDT